jgi:hypothetical protein
MMMPPNAYPPYGYMPAPPPTTLRQWPVPSARHVPLIWTITLAVVTVIAVALIGLSSAVTTAAPALGGTTAYANSLANNDNAWTNPSSAQGQCAYANGGLDATTNTFNALEVDRSLGIIGFYDPVPLCTLQGQNPTDLTLSVRLLPQANLNNTLEPAIFVHSAVAIAFTTTGEFAVLFHNQDDGKWDLLYQALTNQWHTAAMLSNTVVVQVRGDIYTIALNDAQIYHGDFNTNATDFPTSGTLALGAFTSGAGDVGEAAYADFTLTTP